MARANLSTLLSTVKAEMGAGSDETAPAAPLTPAVAPETSSGDAPAADDGTTPAAPADAAPGAPQGESVPEARPEPAERSRGRRATKATAPGRTGRSKTTASQAEGPRYLQLERKETRLRDDQYAELTSRARALNKLRRGAGERITENTLIRVAIDLLLEQADDLAGFTEDDLRKSVGL